MSSRSSRRHALRATTAALALAGLAVGGFGVTAASADTSTTLAPAGSSSSAGLVCDLLPILCPSPTATVTATTTATTTATETATATATTTATATATETQTTTATATATATATQTTTATATSTVTATTTVTATPAGSGGSTGTGTTSTADASKAPKPFTNITVSGLRIAQSKGRLIVSFTVDNTGTTSVGGVLVTAKVSGYGSKAWLVRLPVGLPVRVTGSWPVRTHGKVRVSVKADPSNQLVESNENDNTVTGTKVLR